MFGLTPYRRNNGINNRDGFNDFERVFDDFFSDTFNLPAYFYDARQMKVDIKEEDKEYIVEAELPGVNKEDIKIDLRDNQLTIMVQRDEQVNSEKENYIHKERRTSSISRSFYIENVKNEDVNAKFENGLLSIKLPKREPGSMYRRQIDIQ
jgi:Molecular chaperone (small heat shock protein)